MLTIESNQNVLPYNALPASYQLSKNRHFPMPKSETITVNLPQIIKNKCHTSRTGVQVIGWSQPVTWFSLLQPHQSV